jgi:hypothetical protein
MSSSLQLGLLERRSRRACLRTWKDVVNPTFSLRRAAAPARPSLLRTPRGHHLARGDDVTAALNDCGDSIVVRYWHTHDLDAHVLLLELLFEVVLEQLR